MYWIVITIKPNQFIKAEKNLIAQNIDCFFPKVELKRGKKKTIKNLFPGYGFVNLASWDQLPSIASTRGVSRVVSFNSKIPTLPASVIESIQEKLLGLSKITDQCMIQKDDTVIINSVLLRGMKAKVLDVLKAKESQIVLLKIFDQPQTIWFNIKDILPERDFLKDYSTI